jgi:hypothetical protein
MDCTGLVRSFGPSREKSGFFLQANGENKTECVLLLLFKRQCLVQKISFKMLQVTEVGKFLVNGLPVSGAMVHPELKLDHFSH